MLRAIILDMDGTLCESEEAHRAAFNRAFAEGGLPYLWEPEVYGRLLAVKGGRDRLAHFLRAQGEADAEALAARLHGAKTAHFAALLAREGVPPRPGVPRLMAAAEAAGVRLALATSATLPTATALVEAVLGPGGMGRFDAVATGDQVAANKPAPDLYCLALERLGLPASACVALEDDPAGLAAARAAGVAVVVTPSAYAAGADFSGANAVVADLDHGPAGPVDLAWLAERLAAPPPHTEKGKV